AATVETGAAPDTSPAAAAGAQRWEISFRPYAELFARGNDPLRMMRELAELGSLESNVDVSSMPAFADLDPQSCYFAWHLVLTADLTESAIRQVFEWAEGDCALQIKQVAAGGVATSPTPAAAPVAAAPVAPALIETASVAPAPIAAAPAATPPASASASS